MRKKITDRLHAQEVTSTKRVVCIHGVDMSLTLRSEYMNGKVTFEAKEVLCSECVRNFMLRTDINPLNYGPDAMVKTMLWLSTDHLTSRVDKLV